VKKGEKGPKRAGGHVGWKAVLVWREEKKEKEEKKKFSSTTPVNRKPAVGGQEKETRHQSEGGERERRGSPVMWDRRPAPRIEGGKRQDTGF